MPRHRPFTLCLALTLLAALPAAANWFEAWPCKWKGFSLDGKGTDVSLSCAAPEHDRSRCTLVDRQGRAVAVGFMRHRSSGEAHPVIIGHLWNSREKPPRAVVTLELRTRDHGTLAIVFEQAAQARLLRELGPGSLQSGGGARGLSSARSPSSTASRRPSAPAP